MTSVPDMTVSGQLDARQSPKAIQYPNKIFSLSEHYIPSTPRELFKFCRYYYNTHGPLQQAIVRASRYLITDLQFETDNADLEDAYHDLFYRKWNIRNLLTEIGIYRKVYGNCFVSVHIIPQRYVKCNVCGHMHRAINFVQSKEFVWRRFRFHGRCIKCHQEGEFQVVDVHPKKPEFVRLVIWDPSNIDIVYNEITGETAYYYSIPQRLRAKITAGNPDIISTTPQMFIQAVKEGRKVRLRHRNLFHFARPGLSASEGGWGSPAPVPALPELFHRGVLRRAQEAVAAEHIVPLRLLFPNSNTDQPAQIQYDLGDFKSKVEDQLKKWKADPNHIAIVPYPVGVSDFSGKGRSLMVTSEIAQADQTAVVGAGYPIEFVWGGLSYSGSSVSLRMLENDFINERADIEDFFEFIVGIVAPFLSWKPLSIRLSEFKMADDQLRRDFMLKLNMMGKVSDDTMLSELGMDAKVEAAKIRKELRENLPTRLMQSRLEARTQGEAQLELAGINERIQKRMMAEDPAMAGMAGEVDPVAQGGDPAAQAQAGGQDSSVDVPTMAWMQAHEIGQMEPAARQDLLNQIQQETPNYHSMLMSILGDDGQDPLPEQRPGQRATPMI